MYTNPSHFGGKNDYRKDIESTFFYLKLIFVLFLVCLTAFFLLPKILPRLAGFVPVIGKGIQILGRYPLEQRKSLYVIQVGSEYHLLGVSEQNVNHLLKIPEDSVKSLLESKKGLGRGKPFLGKGRRSFSDVIQGLRNPSSRDSMDSNDFPESKE